MESMKLKPFLSPFPLSLQAPQTSQHPIVLAVSQVRPKHGEVWWSIRLTRKALSRSGLDTLDYRSLFLRQQVLRRSWASRSPQSRIRCRTLSIRLLPQQSPLSLMRPCPQTPPSPNNPPCHLLPHRLPSLIPLLPQQSPCRTRQLFRSSPPAHRTNLLTTIAQDPRNEALLCRRVQAHHLRGEVCERPRFSSRKWFRTSSQSGRIRQQSKRGSPRGRRPTLGAWTR